ncbi:L,D-transpeptidase [Leeia oryzae]|uniref:L,D-transpeptidase n=1 Tax=Leeia oryzae TaxID=356662 RepID=UPI00036F7A7E|nr:L,D-transpeptidase [Leeia oryzae]
MTPIPRPISDVAIRILLDEQVLELISADGTLIRSFQVSTAAKGAGEQMGSYQTPRGKHRIRAKIGAGMPDNTVFVGRRPTGEIFDDALDQAHPNRDWILTRILWLCGEEPGFNRFGTVDTQRRYIYIHGTPERVDILQPGSHGCIRMRNQDLITLFDLVPAGCKVDILEHRP